jgi:hypothetical protein
MTGHRIFPWGWIALAPELAPNQEERRGTESNAMGLSLRESGNQIRRNRTA